MADPPRLTHVMARALVAAGAALLAVIALSLAVSAARAQQVFDPTYVVQLQQVQVASDSLAAVSGSSTRVALSGPTNPNIWVRNPSANGACVRLGDVTVAAPAPSGGTCAAGSTYVGAGRTAELGIAGNAYIAARTASGSATLALVEGYYQYAQFGSAGTVTANQGAAGVSPWPVITQPSQPTAVDPDVSTVTTGGTAVNAFAAGNCAKGCFVVNNWAATTKLCGRSTGTASGTDNNGGTSCVGAGQTLTFAPTAAAISVVTSDNNHPFSGTGYK